MASQVSDVTAPAIETFLRRRTEHHCTDLGDYYRPATSYLFMDMHMYQIPCYATVNSCSSVSHRTNGVPGVLGEGGGAAIG